MIQFEMSQPDSGKKLHRYLRQALPGLPLSGVYKMIRVGRIKVNGKKGNNDTLLQAGDIVTIYMPEQEYQALSRPAKKFGGVSKDIDIVYEDAHLLVVNKPVGLLTHPDATEHKDTLISRALAYLHSRGELSDGRAFMPATVNRLDRNTSGIVLIGKDGDTLRKLAQDIREHRLSKFYLTVVWGAVAEAGEVNSDLVRDERSGRTLIAGRVHARRPDDNLFRVQGAVTRYEPWGTAGPFTLLKVEIESGRTHQIRAHLQDIGHPLLGDVKYGGKLAFGVNHHLLHAQSVVLADGTTFFAPPSAAFMSVLQQSGLVRFLRKT